ncbi:helix-turn-helix transcriptional regulator [Gallaecimonas mangrovi]|uniref:helix-turn-helix transcriptional regulator n=1 Tax=Gallaecimonas mangrovi TaxID=2291597 RepID=UPI000E1FD808|nr:AraC family transcriptional regulator [Gallaecimonas mangrovi]
MLTAQFECRYIDEDFRQTALHQHANGQLLVNLSAMARIDTLHQHWLLPKGSAVWLPGNMPHGVRSFGACRGYSGYFPTAMAAQLPGAIKVFQSGELLRSLMKKSAEFAAGHPLHQHLVPLLINEIDEALAQPFVLELPTDKRLQEMAAALVAKAELPVTVEQAAKALHISPKTLQRRWQQSCGSAFKSWLIQLRMLKAAELLGHGQSVTAVALELGYQSISTFIDIFKARFAVTPGQYRRQLQAAG